MLHDYIPNLVLKNCVSLVWYCSILFGSWFNYLSCFGLCKFNWFLYITHNSFYLPNMVFIYIFQSLFVFAKHFWCSFLRTKLLSITPWYNIGTKAEKINGWLTFWCHPGLFLRRRLIWSAKEGLRRPKTQRPQGRAPYFLTICITLSYNPYLFLLNRQVIGSGSRRD